MNTLLKIASQLSAEDLDMMDASLAKRKAQAERKGSIVKGSLAGALVGGATGLAVKRLGPLSGAGVGTGLGAAAAHLHNARKVKKADAAYKDAEHRYILKKIKQG
jgi:uncharacterized membrane protein